MLPTHALFGMCLALPVAVLSPEHAPVALAAGLIGGVLPDLDLYTGHRKTLHYPVCYSLLAVATGLWALASTTPAIASWLPAASGTGASTASVAAALLFAAAAAHCLLDVFGGGLELRPWEATSERAVYDHVRRRWIAPRRWVRYDGAPEDLLLSVTLAVPLWFTLEGILRWVVVASLTVAVVYTAVRRLLPRIAEELFDGDVASSLPTSVLAYVPARYLND